eukprot:gene24887-66588_t
MPVPPPTDADRSVDTAGAGRRDRATPALLNACMAGDGAELLGDDAFAALPPEAGAKHGVPAALVACCGLPTILNHLRLGSEERVVGVAKLLWVLNNAAPKTAGAEDESNGDVAYDALRRRPDFDTELQGISAFQRCRDTTRREENRRARWLLRSYRQQPAAAADDRHSDVGSTHSDARSVNSNASWATGRDEVSERGGHAPHRGYAPHAAGPARGSLPDRRSRTSDYATPAAPPPHRAWVPAGTRGIPVPPPVYSSQFDVPYVPYGGTTRRIPSPCLWDPDARRSRASVTDARPPPRASSAHFPRPADYAGGRPEGWGDRRDPPSPSLPAVFDRLHPSPVRVVTTGGAARQPRADQAPA